MPTDNKKKKQSSWGNQRQVKGKLPNLLWIKKQSSKKAGNTLLTNLKKKGGKNNGKH